MAFLFVCMVACWYISQMYRLNLKNQNLLHTLPRCWANAMRLVCWFLFVILNSFKGGSWCLIEKCAFYLVDCGGRRIRIFHIALTGKDDALRWHVSVMTWLSTVNVTAHAVHHWRYASMIIFSTGQRKQMACSHMPGAKQNLKCFTYYSILVHLSPDFSLTMQLKSFEF